MTAAAAVDALLAAIETEEEGEILKDLLVRADLAKECAKCDELHRQAGQLCISCKGSLARETSERWTIGYEGEGDPDAVAWTLRSGNVPDTTIRAVETTIPHEDSDGGKLWAALMLERDFGVTVYDWTAHYPGPGTSPDYWIAVTHTD